MKNLIAMAVLAGTLLQCKPAASELSRTRTIDRFVDGATEKTNFCGVNLSSSEEKHAWFKTYEDQVIADTEDLRLEVWGTLMHAPPLLAQYFFALGGKVTIRGDAQQLCEQARLTPEEQDFASEAIGPVTSCWRQRALGTPPFLILPPDAEAIRHNLLRLLSYVFVEFIVPRMEVSEFQAYRATAKSFHQYRRQLSAALMIDIANETTKSAQRLRKLADTHPTLFSQFVFAETMDSYFCSSNTRSIATERFSTLMDVLHGKVDASLLRDLRVHGP